MLLTSEQGWLLSTGLTVLHVRIRVLAVIIGSKLLVTTEFGFILKEGRKSKLIKV